jgi:signal peptide peptidase-like protein 2B
MNDKEDLFKMVCSENDTFFDIKIPIVMIPKSAGESLQDHLSTGQKVDLLLYSPNQPFIDFSEIFMWMMAVGTIVCASLWSKFIGNEQCDDRYKQLTRKETQDDISVSKVEPEEDVMHITTKAVVFFILISSIFLMLFYWFMSDWFVWILIILFCIGGVEEMHICLVALLSRSFGRFDDMTIKVPIVVRYDRSTKKSLWNGYFLWSTIGYRFGLFLTYVALHLMDGHGQPTLLYLVPCTLGLILILALL